MAAVAYTGNPEEFAAQVYALFPGRKFVYMYQKGYPQDQAIGDRLAKTAAASDGNVRVEVLDHTPTINDFADNSRVYFSWYTFETMFESGRSLDILHNRIVATSTRDNVEADNLAAVGVSSSDKEIGEAGAALLMNDLLKVKPLRNADVAVPPLHHWVNCRNAARLNLVLAPEVIQSADEAFECEEQSSNKN